MPIIDSQHYSETDQHALQPILWSDSFSVSDPDLDCDHLRMIAWLNAVYLAISGGFAESTIRSLMAQLSKNALEHLDREIAVLRRSGYPQTGAHEVEHDAIREEVKALNARSPDFSLAELTRIAMAAKAAMLTHLIGQDSRFKSYLQVRMGM